MAIEDNGNAIFEPKEQDEINSLLELVSKRNGATEIIRTAILNAARDPIGKHRLWTAASHIISQNPDLAKGIPELLGERVLQAKKKSGKFVGASVGSDGLGSFNDPSSYGFVGRRQQYSWRNIRDSFRRNSVVQAIVKTRLNQLSDFYTPSTNNFQRGFTIESVHGETSPGKVSRVMAFLLGKACIEREDTLTSCGFREFMKRLMTDSLLFDHAAFGISYSEETGRPESFHYIPAEMVEILRMDERKKYPKILGAHPKFILGIEGTDRKIYYDWQVCLCIRNVGQGEYLSEYGYPEILSGRHIINAWDGLMEWNAQTLYNGGKPTGILALKGGASSGHLGAHVSEDIGQNLARTIKNSNVAILNVPNDLEYVNLSSNGNEFEYEGYNKILISLICSIWSISPEEIGWKTEVGYQSSQSTRGQLNEKSYSQSKGLVPILRNIEDWINRCLVMPFTNGEYVFKFRGYDKEETFNYVDFISKSVGTVITLNEARRLVAAALGLEEIELPYGDAPGNSIFASEKEKLEQQLRGPAEINAEAGDMGADGGPEEGKGGGDKKDIAQERQVPETMRAEGKRGKEKADNKRNRNLPKDIKEK